MIPTLHIHLLGDFLLVSGDTPVTTVDVPRLQSLLAYLVLHRAAPQARSHLAFLFWPDSTEAQARAYLRKLVYQLRQALPNIDAFLHVDTNNLQWVPEQSETPWELDILHLEQAIVQAEQAEQAQDTAAMRQALEQVLRLYRGDLLPSCYDEWILSERDRIRQLFFVAAERLITLLEQEREYDAAIKVAQQLLRHDRLDETVYRQLMRCYALQGNRAAALRVYHTCVTALERELASEPSEATRQAYEALLQMDRVSEQKRTPISSREGRTPLVGRKQQWAHLQAAWHRAARGYPHMVVISGEAGIGKTMLAEEVLAWVSRQGITTASAHCYAVEGRLAYAPITSWLQADAIQAGLSTLDPLWLTEVARLVPDLLTGHSNLAHPKPMREGWQRQHFFEALAHALLDTHQPLLLLLDDLQWCDNETLELLHYLLHFEPKARLLLIGTMRSEETQPEHPLVTFLGAMQRESLMTEIVLGPLNTAETASLAEQIMGLQLDAATTSRLYCETEGNPLFVVEMVRASRGVEPNLVGNPPSLFTHTALTLPPTIQAILTARLAQLSPSARELANLAAVIGRAFSFEVLACASSDNEVSLVQGFDELWQRRIVREQGMDSAETYEFSHDKLREQAYISLSPAYRRLLHRRAAKAFETVYAKDLDAVCRQIAYHYERAGLAGQALPYYQRAGMAASQVYANEEAITAFQQAVTLLEANSQERKRQDHPWQEIAHLYEDMGNVFERTGRLQEAKQAYQCAMTYVPQHEYVWQARLQHEHASTWQVAPANPQGSTHPHALKGFQEAERLLERASAEAAVGWQQEWIQLQIAQLFPLRSSVEEMTIVIEKVQAIVEQYGTAAQRCRFYLAVCLRDVARDRYVVAQKTVLDGRNALAAAQQTENKSLIGFAQFSLAVCLLWSGHIDEGEEQMHAAIRVGEQLNDAILLARCLTFLPFIYRRRGQVEELRQVITRALTLPEARNIRIITGHRAWLAWHDGDMSLAESYGQTLLEDRHQQQQFNSFYWTGLWPLIDIALAQDRIAEAMDYTRILLEPTQQPPLEPLLTRLEMVIRTWDNGQTQEARALLQEVLPLAKELGYL